MNKFLLSTIVVLLCVSVQAADLIVYKLNYTITRTGGATSKKIKVSGWLLIDNATQQLALIKAEAAAKRFNAELPPDFKIADIRGSAGKSFSVVHVGQGTISGRLSAKGTDNFRNPFALPTTLIVTGSDIFQIGGLSGNFLDDYAGSMSIDKVKIADFQNRSFTFENALDSMRMFFALKEYAEYDTF